MDNTQFIILMSTLVVMFLLNKISNHIKFETIKSLEKEMKDYHKFMKGRNR